jgi:hypothetical protein
MRTEITSARRAEMATAILAARAAEVRASAITELKAIIQPDGYTPIAIASVSTIAHGATGATVVVTLTGDAFETGIANADLTVSVGTTGLTLSTTTRNTSTQITCVFTGTSDAGVLSIIVKASGLVTSPYLPTNAVEITVPVS